MHDKLLQPSQVSSLLEGVCKVCEHLPELWLQLQARVVVLKALLRSKTMRLTLIFNSNTIIPL